MAQIAGEHAAQAALEKKAQTYFEERPKIDEGLKTLLSIKLAVQTSSPVKGGAGNTFANDGVLEIIRCLSLSINSLELLKPMAWAAKFPESWCSRGWRKSQTTNLFMLYTPHYQNVLRIKEESEGDQSFRCLFFENKRYSACCYRKDQIAVADRSK